MKNIFKTFKLIMIAAVFSLASCETTDLDLQQSPNALTPSQASADFLLNNSQRQLAAFFEDVTEEGMELTRILHFFGPDYFTGYGTGQLNTPYSRVYATVLPDLYEMYNLATADGLTVHLGMGQIIEAYLMLTLVDYIGDVPYAEAVQGAGNLNPSVESGAEIYNKMEALLDTALANLQTDAPLLPNDLYYGNASGTPDISKWIKLANTLKLKIYLQTRLVDGEATSKINAVLNQPLISDSSDDFEFKYGITDQNPDSRHPIFSRNYDTGVTDYQQNSFMNTLANGKSVVDPRTRFYIYRQSDSPGDDTQLPCNTQSAPAHYPANEAFCYVPGGYWGRDHGNSQPIPPDNALRSNWGLYPVGGRFDDNSFSITNSREQGAKGAGISPIMLSSFVKFMQAEASLALGTTGNAKNLMIEGITQSINKVIGFQPDAQVASFVPAAGQINSYINEVSAEYDAATTNDERMNIIMREYFIALYGNGVEAYNSYRRTGKPDTLQPALSSSPGAFIRSFFFPTNAVNNNSNISQKPDQTIPVFWDTNPAGFVD
jgi:hypothetical protein